ncbi:MAG: TspO/MBR family protein [Verrucomicrobiota bacterium]
MNSILKLILCLAATLGVGWIGGWATSHSIHDWYPGLAKPSWTPPNAAFPIVWTSLYLIMAVSTWRIWNLLPGRKRNLALSLFGIQLFFNVGWSFWFFYFQRIDLAFFWLGLLCTLVGLMVFAYLRLITWVGLINLPYLIWVLYAFALNFEIWRLNV